MVRWYLEQIMLSKSIRVTQKRVIKSFDERKALVVVRIITFHLCFFEQSIYRCIMNFERKLLLSFCFTLMFFCGCRRTNEKLVLPDTYFNIPVEVKSIDLFTYGIETKLYYGNYYVDSHSEYPFYKCVDYGKYIWCETRFSSTRTIIIVKRINNLYKACYINRNTIMPHNSTMSDTTTCYSNLNRDEIHAILPEFNGRISKVNIEKIVLDFKYSRLNLEFFKNIKIIYHSDN